MKKSVALPFVALTLAAVVAAGCSGNGSNVATGTSTPSPAPTPSVACTSSLLPAGEQIQEVFPQKNGTAVPNVQGMVFAVSPSPLPTNWYVYATSSFGTTAGTSSIAFLATPSPAASGSTPAPLPTPSDTPAFANPIYETASIGIFATGTTFTIYLANTNCFPGFSISSFTTSPTDLPSPAPTST